MSMTGTMLRLARQLRGFQQNEACERLRVTTSELSRVENGIKDPGDEMIKAAALAYDLPEAFFKQTEAVYGAPVSVHPPKWRKKADVPSADVHRVVAELNIRVMHLRRLLEATDVEPLRQIPVLDSDEYGNDAEQIAGLVRGVWQIPDGPIHDLTAIVEEAGIVVAHSDFGGASISGVTFRVPGVPPLIVLNRTHPSDRMRFTLGHELGHIVMHRFPTPYMEKEADVFSSTLLVPTKDVKPYFAGRRVDLRLLAALKPEWRVSMGSLVFAAKRAGAINDAQMTNLWKQFNIHGIRMNEPPELDFQSEQPGTLSDLIGLHMNELGYSISDLAVAMRMHDDEVARTYSIALPGQDGNKPRHLRVVK